MELLNTLRELKIGAIITDTAGRRDCAHMDLTVPRAFIRFVGNSLHPTDYTRIDDWVNRMHYWLQQGMEEIYFFMHMHDEAYSPELTVYMVDKIKAEHPEFLRQEPYVATDFVRINTTRKELSDRRVRMALSKAIDRKLLCDHLLQGNIPCGTISPPMGDYNPDQIVSYDPEAPRHCSPKRAIRKAAASRVSRC